MLFTYENNFDHFIYLEKFILKLEKIFSKVFYQLKLQVPLLFSSIFFVLSKNFSNFFQLQN